MPSYYHLFTHAVAFFLGGGSLAAVKHLFFDGVSYAETHFHTHYPHSAGTPRVVPPTDDSNGQPKA